MEITPNPTMPKTLPKVNRRVAIHRLIAYRHRKTARPFRRGVLVSFSFRFVFLPESSSFSIIRLGLSPPRVFRLSIYLCLVGMSNPSRGYDVTSYDTWVPIISSKLLQHKGRGLHPNSPRNKNLCQAFDMGFQGG